MALPFDGFALFLCRGWTGQVSNRVEEAGDGGVKCGSGCEAVARVSFGDEDLLSGGGDDARPAVDLGEHLWA